MKIYSLEELEGLTLAWSEERGILTNGKASTQALKLISEAGELTEHYVNGECVKDDIGDCLVLLCNLSHLTGSISVFSASGFVVPSTKPLLNLLGDFCDDLIKEENLDEDIIDIVQKLKEIATEHKSSLEECWSVAYEDIKDRKGYLNSLGNFIKETK